MYSQNSGDTTHSARIALSSALPLNCPVNGTWMFLSSHASPLSLVLGMSLAAQTMSACGV